MMVLPFIVRSTRLALPVEQIVRVLPMLPVDKVGQTPDFIRGAVNLFGRSMMVLDMASRLGWPPSTLSPWQPFIWVMQEPFEALLSVDHVDLVCDISLPNTRETRFDDWPEALIKHMVPCQDSLLFISDINALLTSNEVTQCQHWLQQTQPQQTSPRS